MYLKISKYISVAVISLLLPFASYAQQTESEKAQQTVEDLTKKEAPVFGGVALSGDLVGVVMKSLNSDYSQMEVAAHLNFKEKYFPVLNWDMGKATVRVRKLAIPTKPRHLISASVWTTTLLKSGTRAIGCI